MQMNDENPARGVIQRIRSGVAAAREPIVDRVGQAATGVERSWKERPGARVRRVRRMATQPLPYLYDLHPEARSARPVEVGLRAIDIEETGGTAVAGAQRGGDFLPLKAPSVAASRAVRAAGRTLFGFSDPDGNTWNVQQLKVRGSKPLIPAEYRDGSGEDVDL